jgi:hypothetical protein
LLFVSGNSSALCEGWLRRRIYSKLGSQVRGVAFKGGSRVRARLFTPMKEERGRRRRGRARQSWAGQTEKQRAMLSESQYIREEEEREKERKRRKRRDEKAQEGFLHFLSKGQASTGAPHRWKRSV